MSNRQDGLVFERRFCNILCDYGYWVHNMAQNTAGQPADVIACKCGKSYLIDCKVCSGTGFPFSRVEFNQHNAMALWSDTGNGCGWFALYIESTGQIWMVKHTTITRMMKDGQAGIKFADLGQLAIPFEKWVMGCR